MLMHTASLWHSLLGSLHSSASKRTQPKYWFHFRNYHHIVCLSVYVCICHINTTIFHQPFSQTNVCFPSHGTSVHVPPSPMATQLHPCDVSLQEPPRFTKTASSPFPQHTSSRFRSPIQQPYLHFSASCIAATFMSAFAIFTRISPSLWQILFASDQFALRSLI